MHKCHAAILTALILFVGALQPACVPAGPGSASERANAQADTAMHKPVTYSNTAKQGPQLIVLPGDIKSNNASFIQRVTENNIADFGELELGRANFKVLERSDLGPMLNEINFAVNMGDPTALQKFKRGKMQSTKWFVKFDILKAEQVAKAAGGFSGDALGSIANILVGGKAGAVTDTTLSSTQVGDSAGVWIVGLRYKIIDASTSEQVATNYFETKMEVGKQASSVLGVSGSSEQMVTLDTVVHRLIEQAVAEIDQKK